MTASSNDGRPQASTPAAPTNGDGIYTLVVPAPDLLNTGAYSLLFSPDRTRYAFTLLGAGLPDFDDDASADGSTASFTAPAAGGTDNTRDAGLRDIAFDLDVNANGSITDPVDGAANYLPGYEGGVAKLSTENSYNTAVYTGQLMKLMVDGIGSQSADVTKIEFAITGVTNYPGYASDRSDPRVEGAGFDKDYSFSSYQDMNSYTINRASIAGYYYDATVGGFDQYSLRGGQMEATKTWVYFYAKDYGGGANLEARVWVRDGAGERMARVIPLKVPKDDDLDAIADSWELDMYYRWSNQYQGLYNFSLGMFSPNDDNELADPDDASGPLVAQKETGDGHNVLEEYRGYILDGGGLDGSGANGFAGGHIRLDPARKEVLLEVDRAATLNNVPAGGLSNVLNGAAKVFSNAERGAGIYLYYLFDQTQLDIPKEDVDSTAEQRAKLAATRNPQLMSDFIHVLFFDQGKYAPAGAPAAAYGRRATAGVVERGVVFATTEVNSFYPATDFPKRDEAFATSLAHEITHLLIDVTDGAFNVGEHTIAPYIDESDLMYERSRVANRELATVKFFPVLQAQLSTKTSEGLG